MKNVSTRLVFRGPRQDLLESDFDTGNGLDDTNGHDEYRAEENTKEDDTDACL